MKSFKPGDVVLLKSGGPAITIVDYSEKDRVSCVWWNDCIHRLEYAEFSTDVVFTRPPKKEGSKK